MSTPTACVIMDIRKGNKSIIGDSLLVSALNAISGMVASSALAVMMHSLLSCTSLHHIHGITCINDGKIGGMRHAGIHHMRSGRAFIHSPRVVSP